MTDKLQLGVLMQRGVSFQQMHGTMQQFIPCNPTLALVTTANES
jgi:hypothetical protein